MTTHGTVQYSATTFLIAAKGLRVIAVVKIKGYNRGYNYLFFIYNQDFFEEGFDARNCGRNNDNPSNKYWT